MKQASIQGILSSTAAIDGLPAITQHIFDETDQAIQAAVSNYTSDFNAMVAAVESKEEIELTLLNETITQQLANNEVGRVQRLAMRFLKTVI